MMEAFVVLLSLCFFGLVVVVVWVVTEAYDSHAAKMARIKAEHDETVRQIDRTAEYYVGLYRYIAKRVDDQSRRRQSG